MKLDRDRLIRAREMLGYGVEKTAEEAGVSKNSVLRAEHEEDIRPGTARKIAAALGVAVADLLEEIPSPKVTASAPLEDRPGDAGRKLAELLQEARARSLPAEESIETASAALDRIASVELDRILAEEEALNLIEAVLEENQQLKAQLSERKSA